MKNKIWEENLAVLHREVPGLETLLLKEIEQPTEKVSPLTITLTEAINGNPITVATYGQQTYYLSGKYDPDRLARRKVDPFLDMDFGATLLVIGISDGRILRQLLPITEKGVVILVYEPSVEIFLHTMQHYDIRDLLEQKSMVLAVRGLNDRDLSKALDQLVNVNSVTRFRTLIQGNYKQLFPSEIKEVLSKVNENLTNLHLVWNTWQKFAEVSITNCIQNYKYLYHHYSADALYDTLPEDVPVIVVAAGPSLDKNVDLLAEAQGKACIIACDTALNPLLKRGIIPDLFVVVDPDKSMELYKDERMDRIPMITGLDIPVAVMRKHTGKKFIYLESFLTVDLLRYVLADHLEKRPMSVIPTGGSVANTAFSAGRLMGAKTIILVGQDLAFTREKMHAEGTLQKDFMLDLENEDFLMVEGVDGGQVPTRVDFIRYLKWFEDEIRKYHDSLHVVDATEGGALIHGSEVLTLRESLDRYCTKSFDFETCLTEIPEHFTDEERKKVLEFFSHIPTRLENMKTEISKGIGYYRKLEKCIHKKSCSPKELQGLLKKIKETNEALEKDHLLELIMQGTKQEEYGLRTSLFDFENDGQKDSEDSIKLGQRYLEILQRQLEEMVPMFEELGRFQGEYE